MLTEWAAPTGHRFTSPVLHQGAHGLLYAWFKKPGTVVTEAEIVLARGTAPSFSQYEDSILSSDILGRSDGNRLLPTGLSSDGLTLFYWDEEAEELSAIWRTNSVAFFYTSETLGDFAGGTPNQACDRLYFSGSGELRVATAD
jgi:hypothetical protein